MGLIKEQEVYRSVEELTVSYTKCLLKQYLAHSKIPSINAVIVIYSCIHQIFTTHRVRPWEFIMNKIDTFPPHGDCTY